MQRCRARQCREACPAPLHLRDAEREGGRHWEGKNSCRKTRGKEGGNGEGRNAAEGREAKKYISCYLSLLLSHYQKSKIKMRASWIFGIAVLVLTVALVHAGPLPDEETSTGSKTLHALRQFFSPVTNYFSSIPSKTPSDIADDVRGSVDNVRDWASENEAIQALRGALNPVRDWIKEKANVVKGPDIQ
ncbi:hypothetical protein O3P69_003518 [Scylla paramamosain]|uniref:Uncharacterized protein n=1 Tax=Scylla paramamosain TaxID=85552 RepID=A0AAW0UMP6_SCYPA